jgi:segregation and condensation protein A
MTGDQHQPPGQPPPDPERAASCCCGDAEAAAQSAQPNAASGPADSQPAERASSGAGAAGYRVRLPAFEGPLDLLLHLIQQHELDILDIPIAFITEKYVQYITLMQQLNIDLASEYLVMAATLLHIKSKMLLPSLPEDQEEGEPEPEEDPRAELVRRLLEYQKYRDAAEQLGERNVLGRDVFGRGMPVPAAEEQAPLAPVSLFKLLEAFQSVMDRAQIRTDHEVELERFSITDRINELSDVLRVRPRVQFDELFAGQSSRAALIVTFLALLEMTRLRLTRLIQSGPLAPILVELAVRDEDEEQLPQQSRAQDTASFEGAAGAAAEAQAAGGEPSGPEEGAASAAPGPEAAAADAVHPREDT